MIIGCGEFGRLDRAVAVLLGMPPLPPIAHMATGCGQAKLRRGREMDAHEIAGKEVDVV